MSKNICAPSNKYDYSCFTIKDLKEMAKEANKIYGGNININKYHSKDKRKLLKDIHKNLTCGNMNFDSCILKNYDAQFNKLVKKTFKPRGPDGQYDWLSSIDIANVMEQYMKKYKDFVFFGPLPIDFANFESGLNKLNLKKLRKTKKKIGIIFNTDPSYKSGEHWISMFIDLENKTICFFDSVGSTPPPEVIVFMNKMIKMAKEQLNIRLKKIINTKQHQYKNTECGVYSLYFIISRLQGKSCDFINNKIVKDEEINKMRKKFFRNQSLNH